MKVSKHLAPFGLMFLLYFTLLATSAWAQYDGSWSGPLASFSVSGGNVQDLTLRMCPFGSCDSGFDWMITGDIPISENIFSFDDGTNNLTGTFTSATTCTIDYEYWYWDYNLGTYFLLQGTYAANLVFITITPSSIDFGEHSIDTESDTSLFELKDIRDTTVTGSVYLTGTAADQFEITGGGGAFSLTQGQTKTIYVKFVPTSTGTKEATLIADTDSPFNDASVSLTGTGIFPVLSVTPDFRSISANSGSTTFDVDNTGNGTMPWTAEVNPADTWLTITSGSSGTDSGIITVSYEANGGPDRTATITVIAGGAASSPKDIEVQQGSPTLSVTPDYQEVFANSGTATLTIENLSGGTMNWTVSTESPWIADITPPSGTNNGTVSVSYDANDGGERIGSITVTADGANNSPKTVELHQSDDVFKLFPNDGAPDHMFGSSVSIFENYAIVGAYGDDSNEDGAGAAYIFERTGYEWIQRAKLTASDGAAQDWFGCAVSISGDYAIVGAYGDDTAKGAAYLFEKPAGGWADMTETAKLTPNAASSSWYISIQFGRSVSLSGDFAIVGAHGDAGGKGAAYLFEKPVGGWTDMTETAKFTASDGYGVFQNPDMFGRSVSIAGDFAIVGANGDDDNGSSSGSAYLFEKPVGGWTDMTETAKLTASDGAAQDWFGCAVSISGNYVMVGAYGDDDNGSSSGSAYLFEKPVGGWTDMTETVKLTAGDGASDDMFGSSVSISGNYVMVGAYGDDDNGSGSGSAYIFEKSVDSWTNSTDIPKLTAIDGAQDDMFGHSVSISGNYVIVGANGDDDNGSSSGSAYAYDIPAFDYSIDHFEFADMVPPPPQNVCVPFSVTIEAKNSDNVTIPFYAETCLLSGAGDTGSVSLQPTNIPFADGAWTGNVEICSIDTNIVLTVDDGTGHTGASNPFDTVPGLLEHFEFSAFSSPQLSGTPFGITVTAKDVFGYTVTDFTGSISLDGYIWAPSFVEDFEDGNYDRWSEGTGSFTRLVTDETAAVGNYSITLIGSSGYGQTRNGVSYNFAQPQTPEDITFYIRSGNTALSDGYFVLGPQGSCPIFFLMKSDGVMYANEDTSLIYSANTWYKVQFFIDWTAEEFDLYVDDNPVLTDIAFRDSVSSFSDIYLFNYSNSQAWWDEIVFDAGSKTPVSMTPTTTTEFVAGTWTGDVTVHETLDGIFIEGNDGNSHTGMSDLFSVIQDTDGDGISDDDEINIYGTYPNDSDSDDDGIDDGDELNYWLEDWNTNYDGDGITNNLLDNDADGDGSLDGDEINAGYDPADPTDYPGSTPTMSEFAAAFGSVSSDINYQSSCDSDGDGDVDGSDLAGF